MWKHVRPTFSGRRLQPVQHINSDVVISRSTPIFRPYPILIYPILLWTSQVPVMYGPLVVEGLDAFTVKAT